MKTHSLDVAITVAGATVRQDDLSRYRFNVLSLENASISC